MAKKDAGVFSAELLDSLLAGRDPKAILDSGGLIGDLKKALAERMLNAEMDVHLEAEAEAGVSNHRNGSSPKTVLTPDGALELRNAGRLQGEHRQVDSHLQLQSLGLPRGSLRHRFLYDPSRQFIDEAIAFSLCAGRLSAGSGAPTRPLQSQTPVHRE